MAREYFAATSGGSNAGKCAGSAVIKLKPLLDDYLQAACVPDPSTVLVIDCMKSWVFES